MKNLQFKVSARDNGDRVLEIINVVTDRVGRCDYREVTYVTLASDGTWNARTTTSKFDDAPAGTAPINTVGLLGMLAEDGGVGYLWQNALGELAGKHLGAQLGYGNCRNQSYYG